MEGRKEKGIQPMPDACEIPVFDGLLLCVPRAMFRYAVPLAPCAVLKMHGVTRAVDVYAVLRDLAAASARARRNLPGPKARLFQIAGNGLEPNEMSRGFDDFVKVDVGLVVPP